MKKLFCTALLLCSLSAIAGEQGYLTGTNTVELAEGENLIAMWFSNENYSDGPDDISLEIQLPPYDQEEPEIHTIMIRLDTDTAGRTIFGPCRIRVKKTPWVLAYKKTSQEVFPPVNIIMIPIDYEGDVDLMVETSPDLETWTPLYSGSAGTSNSAAFYRTRLIQQ